MIRYEYETEGFTPYTGKSLTEWLNERGSQGWQLTGFERVPPKAGYEAWSYRAVWMRECSTAAEERSGDAK
jgi:hypothetical protein